MLLFVVNCCLKPGSGDNTSLVNSQQPTMGQHKHRDGDKSGIEVTAGEVTQASHRMWAMILAHGDTG